jgi:hypothetical protein
MQPKILYYTTSQVNDVVDMPETENESRTSLSELRYLIRSLY